MYGGMGGLGMGGMGGMSGLGGMGMYGGSSMYGGYGSGMYGGMGGMSGLGGGMYGSGYGTGSAMGMGGGGMLGSSGNMLGMGNGLNGNNNGLGGTGMNGNADPNAPQGSLLPPASDQVASPINQLAAPLPPLNETPEERSRRIHAERRKERQLIKQQREQRRQIRMQAKMEIAGHLTNVLVQTLRSTMELFAVCFGTYYSMKAVRAFANSQDAMSMARPGFQRTPTGQLVPVANATPPAAAAAAKANTAAAPTGGVSRWKTWLLFGALFIVGELLYGLATRNRGKAEARSLRRIKGPIEDEYGNVLTHDELDDLSKTEDSSELSLTNSGDDEEFEQVYRANLPVAGRKAGTKRIYVAMYDFAGQAGDEFLSFKAGDEFVVEDYVEGSWCEALSVDGPHHTFSGKHGLVPGNFLRPLEHFTKL